MASSGDKSLNRWEMENGWDDHPRSGTDLRGLQKNRLCETDCRRSAVHIKAISAAIIGHFFAERHFVQFVLHNPGMHRALEDLDFSKFASLYNGPQYKANQYDTRMKGFYDEFKKQPN